MTFDDETYDAGSRHKFSAMIGIGADYNFTENFYLGVGATFSLKSLPVASMYSVTGNIGYIF